MNSSRNRADGESSPRRRAVPVLWISGAVAAATLVLAVNGTLGAWTTAIIDNTHNDVASTGSVALLETGPGSVTCDTGTSATNQVTCATINKYGGTVSPLNPDGVNTQSVTVNLKNTGTVSGSLVLTADACQSSAAAGSTNADPTGYPVCNKVTVAVACTAPSTLATSAVPLASFTTATVGTLTAGASTDCTFTLNLPASTPSAYASQVASQVLHWTLTAS